jgi:hypothetical protein
VDLLPRDVRVGGEEGVDGFAGFEEIEQRLDGHTGAGEARGTVHDLGIDADDASQSGSLVRCHAYVRIVAQERLEKGMFSSNLKCTSVCPNIHAGKVSSVPSPAFIPRTLKPAPGERDYRIRVLYNDDARSC